MRPIHQLFLPIYNTHKLIFKNSENLRKYPFDKHLLHTGLPTKYETTLHILSRIVLLL